MISVPRHIIKKSRNWYQDTVTGEYIKPAALEKYIKKRIAEKAQLKLL